MKRVLITGASGFIATKLFDALIADGFTIHTLSRKLIADKRVRSFLWDIDLMQIDLNAFEHVDVIIHLAGASIAEKSWSNERKKELIDSRVQSTLLIKKALEQNKQVLKCYIGASASGYYGNSSESLVNEESENGSNFLAEVCRLWEEAHQTLIPYFQNHIILRIPIVLDTKEGALPKMLQTLPVALNYFGSGKQGMPWVHIDDLCSIFIFAANQHMKSGIYNANHPDLVSNKQFVETLAALKKPLLPLSAVPAFMLKLLLGESAAMLLDGQYCSSEKLLKTGFRFSHNSLKEALLHCK